MKRFFVYLSVLILGVSFTSCSEEFDAPPMVVPTATHTPNMSIADFKAKYWQDVNNYIDTVKEDIVIHGWVSANDESGNIYKSLYITDGTAGMNISINGTSLYNTYRVGQEVVINCKDLFIGKYNGQQQIGYPQWYESGSVWEATFLPLATWQSVAELNSLPAKEHVDTVSCSIADLGTDAESLKKWQGRLVRFDGVKFQDADGVNTFANADATTNRNIVDESGNTLTMRNSNYASFRSAMLPLGTGSIVGVLSYYNTSRTSIAGGTWQLYIRSTEDCIGFSTSTKGLLSDPYLVSEAIEQMNQGKNGWVSGYIVGAVAPEVTEVKSNSDIEWKAPTTLDNTLVIGPSADCKDIAQCLVVALPINSPFRQQANLKDWPEVYKSQIKVKGTLATYMGANGITGNSGSNDEFVMSVVTGGLTELSEGFESGIPSDWYNLKVTGDKAWFQTTFDNNGYAAVTGYKGSQPPYESWLITPALDIKKAKSKTLSFKSQVGYSGTDKFEVYVLNSADPTQATVKKKLNPVLATAPASGYSGFVESGDIDLSEFADGTYFVGFCYSAVSASQYQTWCVDDVTFGQKSANANRGDFETFNSGTYTSTYSTYTSNAGWKATNCCLLKGGADDANPVFKFIGFRTGSTTDYAMAVNLLGQTTAVGTLESPVIAGGIKKLEFDYGYAYTESNGVSFKVEVLKNGAVAKTFTVTNKEAAKYTKYSVSEDVNVTGDVTIKITNLSPSNNSTAKKDRVAIWNMTWTQD